MFISEGGLKIFVQNFFGFFFALFLRFLANISNRLEVGFILALPKEPWRG